MSTSTNFLYDSRVECLSHMVTMPAGNYLALVTPAYETRGGLEFQREALKTASGKRIRNRMVEDIIQGAILPPVVIGIVITEGEFHALREQADVNNFTTKIHQEWIGLVSIIDGMQRTTALLEASKQHDISSHPVRVEFWIATTTDSLVYRMLVLNTGQVPWNLKRQLQVVYAPLIKEMQEHVHFEQLFTLEHTGKRSKGGEFSADSLVEAYLSFGLRRTEIEKQETLAEEFSRLDMAEAISHKKYSHYFYPILKAMVDLDLAFSRYNPADENAEEASPKSQYSIGRNIFDSQPARIGFVVAAAVHVLGRLGMDKNVQQSQSSLEQLTFGVNSLVARLNALPDNALGDFLSLDVLSERLSTQKRSAVGRHERSFFENAFKVLIEEGFNLDKMEGCWRIA